MPRDEEHNGCWGPLIISATVVPLEYDSGATKFISLKIMRNDELDFVKDKNERGNLRKKR